MILLWGHAGDATLQLVSRALQTLGAPVAFYDQRRVLQTDIDLTVDGSVSGVLSVEGEQLPLARITAAYIRPFDSRWLPDVQRAGSDSAEWRYAVRIEDALLSWSEIAPGLVINRPSAMSSNGSKPYQAALIRDHGFRVPDTLVTTDPEAALAFRAQHGAVVYKSVSASRSMVSRLTDDRVRRLDEVRWCPTQFQQHVSGIDYRVHVVGEQVFGCEVVSAADDYRFALAERECVELRSFDVPPFLADRCRKLASALQLVVAGIDLRRTEDDEWFCFEANAVPAFSYYQEATGHRIDQAVARRLAAGV